MNVGVIGAGSWGIALTVLLNKNGSKVTVWSKFEDEVKMLSEKREYVDKLPGVKIPKTVDFTTDLEATVKNNEVLIMAVPSTFVRGTAHLMKDGQIIVNVAKGIEENTLMTLSDIIEEEIPQAKVAVMCGPTHAEEVGRGIPTTIVVGAREQSTAKLIQDLFMNETFRVYTSPDVLGMEIGSSLKNVVALAAGIADGLGYGRDICGTYRYRRLDCYLCQHAFA